MDKPFIIELAQDLPTITGLSRAWSSAGAARCSMKKPTLSGLTLPMAQMQCG